MSDYFVTTATLAVIYAIAAVGSCLVVSFAGHINIAQGATMGIGAYTYAILTVTEETSPILALLAAPVAAGMVGAIVVVFMARMDQHVFLLATLALQFVGFETLRRWESVTAGNAGMAGIPRVFDIDNRELFWFSVAMLVVVVIPLRIAMRGKWGLHLRAIRDDPLAAGAFGAPVARDMRWTFAVSSMISGAAGALLAMQISFIVPLSFGLPLSMLVVVMAILGGANILAVCVAAGVFVALPEVIYDFFTVPASAIGPLQQIIYGSALILVMLFRPSGLGRELRTEPPRSGRLLGLGGKS